MTKTNRNRSTPATHSGTRGREVNRHRRRDTSRSQEGNRRLVSSSISLSGTVGETPATDNSQVRLPPGWVEVDGCWYYPTPDGDYRLWHNGGDLVEDTEDHQGTQVDNDGGPAGQDIDANPAHQSWDAVSIRPNQGSAYIDSTQSGTDVDTDHQLEVSYLPDIEAQFLVNPGPWTALDVGSHADGAASQGSIIGGAYPVLTDFEAEENDDPAVHAPQA